MRADLTLARATIEAWRAQHADQLDPVGFRFIDALERRGASHVGETRRLLDQRVSGLLDAYADALLTKQRAAESASTASVPLRSPLGELLEHITSSEARSKSDVHGFEATPEAAVPTQLAALEEFRHLWSAVRSDSHWQQSLAFEPADAGPLNSAALVHRAMALMRELAPGYLQHFLAYADELSWVEQLAQGSAGKPAPRPPTARKRARKKSPT